MTARAMVEVVGLASLGARIYEWSLLDEIEVGGPEPGTLRDIERQAWASAFLPRWQRLNAADRIGVRHELDKAAREALSRAIADAERRAGA